MIQLTKRELNKLNTRKAKVAKLNNDLKHQAICHCQTLNVPV